MAMACWIILKLPSKLQEINEFVIYAGFPAKHYYCILIAVFYCIVCLYDCMRPPLRSTVVRALRSGCGMPGFDPRPLHTKDVITGRFALLSLALGINELGNRLGGSESV